MTLRRFAQLWTHRYHKYSHMLLAYWLGCLAWLKLSIVKTGLKKGQKLIAVIRTEHFGDIVAAEPISRYLRSQYPDAYLVWFVKAAFRELVDYNPSIDQTLEEFCVTQRKFLLHTGVFDQVFELQFRNNNHCLTCQTFTENPVAEKRGIDVFSYFNFGNLLQVFAQTGDLIPAHMPFPADDQPRLYLQERHRKKVDDLHLTQPYIAIHCQSNYVPKDWPADRWNLLIEWIAEHYDFRIVEIGLKSNLRVQTASYQNLCGQLSILETAEVIRRAAYFIGLDSGPSHLGNASGTFGIVLMGALGSFSEYNPYSGGYGRGENAVLIRQNGLICAQLPFDYVRDEIKKVLGAFH